MNWKRILIGKWSWKRPFYSLGSIYLLLVIVAVFFADRIIFIPPPPSYGRDLPGLAFTETQENESIAYIHLQASPGRPTLLYSHGNAEDLADSTTLYDALHESGPGVIAYDFPGYGLSTGSPDEASCQRALVAVWKHLVKSGVPEKSIVIVGRSVGSGPSVWLASREKPAGLVLISAFKSTFTTAFPTPFPILPRDRFPSLSRIRHFKRPLLLLHGESDEVIPVSHGEALFAACPSKDKSITTFHGSGHNDLFANDGDAIVKLITDFTKRVTKN